MDHRPAAALRRTALGPRLWTGALCAGYFLVLLDVTVVAVALPAFATRFDVDGPALAWIADGYAIPFAAFLIPAGRLGDRVGHRTTVVTGLVAFACGSTACALASSLPALTTARAVTGVAAALVVPGGLALATGNAPDDAAAARTTALWASIGGAALPAGPLLGGALVGAYGPTAVFWIAVPVALVSAPIVACGPRGRTDPALPVDPVGAVVVALAVGGAVTAIVEVRNDPAVAGAAAGVVLVCAAVGALRATTRRRARPPSVHSAQRALVGACVVAGVMNLCTIGLLFVVTRIVQDVDRHGPAMAGVLLLPLFAPLPASGPLAGRLVARRGPSAVAVGGLLTGALGFVLVAVAAPHPVGRSIGLGVWGLGIGLLTPAVVVLAVRSRPTAAGLASALSTTSRQVGGALGVALGTVAVGPVSEPGFEDRFRLLAVGCAILFVLAVPIVRWSTRERPRATSAHTDATCGNDAPRA